MLIDAFLYRELVVRWPNIDEDSNPFDSEYPNRHAEPKIGKLWQIVATVTIFDLFINHLPSSPGGEGWPGAPADTFALELRIQRGGTMTFSDAGSQVYLVLMNTPVKD